jgi:multisubunit Na+/H+ antiporter MnhB subunit
MEWLLHRPVVVGIAVIGGVLSLFALLLQRRHGSDHLRQKLNLLSYIFMGASVLLFLIAGLRGPQQ